MFRRENADVSGQVSYGLSGQSAVRAARFVVDVFQETSEAAKFGQYRKISLGRHALAGYPFSDKSGKRESAHEKLVGNTGIFRFGKPKAYQPRPRFLFSLFCLSVFFSRRQHESPILDCMGGFIAY
jgi:hypothetical protein